MQTMHAMNQRTVELLTIPMVATELGIGLRLAYLMVEDGRLRAVRVPGTRSLRVRRDRLEEWKMRHELAVAAG